MFDLAHAIGKSDAKNFHAKMGLVDPIARLSAGPVHFAHAGWAFVDIFPESKPSPDDEFFLLYEHPYSFEADAWLRTGQSTDFAACVMNAGYSAGWCEESFGVKLVSAEVLCRARGDGSCRLVMAHPSKIEAHAKRWVSSEPDLTAQRSSLRAPPAERARYRIPDLFARKRMDEELRERVKERTAQLEKAAEELRHEMQERAQVERSLSQAQRLESVGRLAGGIAHDFNNLMAVILGNAGLALRRLDEGHAARGFLSEISAAGERAAALTRQLVAFSRAQPYAPEVLDLNALVRELARLLERLIGEDVRFCSISASTRDRSRPIAPRSSRSRSTSRSTRGTRCRRAAPSRSTPKPSTSTSRAPRRSAFALVATPR